MTMKLAATSGIVAAMLAVASVQANPISGSISMGGELNLDSSSFSSATQVTSWPLVYVVADSGSFSSVAPLSLVSMSSSPWIFSPAPGVALNNLWSVGGFTFSFASDTVTASGPFLDISGTGTISDTSNDSSSFVWNLSLEQPTTGGPTEFTFSAGTQAGGGGGTGEVPDGGLTLAMLGIAFAGIEIFRRRLGKA
jgi:VPDSG-CTERM motif